MDSLCKNGDLKSELLPGALRLAGFGAIALILAILSALSLIFAVLIALTLLFALFGAVSFVLAVIAALGFVFAFFRTLAVTGFAADHIGGYGDISETEGQQYCQRNDERQMLFLQGNLL
jgi:hypothetical protein